MSKSKEEREFRLRPRKPPVSNGGRETIKLSAGFKTLMHYARQSSSRMIRATTSRPTRLYRQRCAVRITYCKNATRGQWGAHGRYLERDGAGGTGSCFDARETRTGISARLQEWQAQKDELLWKVIISPEFGDRTDLQRLARELMHRVEQDLNCQLEWTAVAHSNTEHPHIHVALRGLSSGHSLRLSREYIKHSVREIAEELCTRQLGFRTSLDAAEAERREVNEVRLTSLDRMILRRARQTEAGLLVDQTDDPKLQQNIVARLFRLQHMELAQRLPDGSWMVKSDVSQILGAMQRTTDHQRVLTAHGELLSDPRLGIEVVNWRQMESVEGRVLVHGQDEWFGKSYLMLEATTARVYYIPYTREMEKVRGRGGLKTNSFTRLQKFFADGQSSMKIDDYGDSEALLKNSCFLQEQVTHLQATGAVPDNDGWGGWLGRYQRALIAEFDQSPAARVRGDRRRRDSLGR